MMKTFSTYFLLIAAAFLAISLAGCKEGGGHASGVAERIKNESVPAAMAGAGTVGEAPQGTVLAKEKYQGGFFWVESRVNDMQRYPCNGCHNDKQVTIGDAASQAHGDIILEHGEESRRLACLTCHKSDNRNFLETEEGTTVEFDHSYKLCGYCHFRQKRDWIGGAHGKRVEFWEGRRVIKNCTSCHDPHSPRFKKRWPKTYSLPLT